MTLDLGLAARLIVGIRTQTAQRTGCPEWDTAGIAAALRATDGPPGAVLASAALAAEDPTLKLPSAAGFKAHWPKNASAPARIPNDVPCPEHRLSMPCRACRDRDDANALTPEQIAEAARLVRLAIRPTRNPTPGPQEES